MTLIYHSPQRIATLSVSNRPRLRARRVRELRDEDRWPIVTNNDRADLKPGQYLLTEKPPEKSAVRFTRSFSARLRAEVLDRNEFTCVMCGLCPGEIDPDTGRKVRLHIPEMRIV
jgi:hypothetical protein